MTKKDYVLIADSIVKVIRTVNANVRDACDRAVASRVLHEVIGVISGNLRKNNPLFDSNRFFNYIKEKV